MKIALLHCFLSSMLYDMTSLIIFWLLPFSYISWDAAMWPIYWSGDVLHFWPLFNLKSISSYTHTNTTTISGLYTILSLLTSNFVLLYTSCRLNIIYIFFIFSFFFFDIIIIFYSTFKTYITILYLLSLSLSFYLSFTELFQISYYVQEGSLNSSTTLFLLTDYVRKFGTFTMKPCM